MVTTWFLTLSYLTLTVLCLGTRMSLVRLSMVLLALRWPRHTFMSVLQACKLLAIKDLKLRRLHSDEPYNLVQLVSEVVRSRPSTLTRT